jgi:hypothetical protein
LGFKNIQMDIQKLEEQVLSEWSNRYSKDSIVKDGIVNLEDYLASDLKVLLILKEANDEGGGGWDLRNFIREGARSQTWNTVTQWLKGIREIENDIHWSDIKKINKNERKKMLSSIAVMNLKKVPGGGSSKKEAIKSAAERDQDLINKQFELYSPDITICCGTGTIVQHVIDVCLNIEWKKTSRAITYGTYDENKHIFRYYHPQARYPGHFKYYMLIDAIKDVLK